MEQIKETAFNWTTREQHGIFTTNEKREIQRIMRLVVERPDEVMIQQRPETNGGYLVARVPKSYFRLTPTRRLTLSDEQRKSRARKMSSINKSSAR